MTRISSEWQAAMDAAHEAYKAFFATPEKQRSEERWAWAWACELPFGPERSDAEREAEAAWRAAIETPEGRAWLVADARAKAILVRYNATETQS